jgi:hypothetical protein
LTTLSQQGELSDRDHLTLVYYLLLQDRVAEALDHFAQVNPFALETRLQYDYFQAYLDFYSDDPEMARGIVAQYVDYPIQHWRAMFAGVADQLKELDGGNPAIIDPKSDMQTHTQLASTEPTFDFEIEGGTVQVTYQNVKQVQVNYYLMDIEVLFSRSPFVQHDSRQFSQIQPNLQASIDLPEKKSLHTFQIPPELSNVNVLVEIVGAGHRKSRTYYAHAMSLQVVENYGQLQVTHDKSKKSLPKTYVKVYARYGNGQVRFFKDGYTDLRGRFDYSSLNTDSIEAVERFAILVIHDDFGAIVREVQPPLR